MTEDDDKKRLQSHYAGRHKAFLVNRHPDAYVKMEREGTLAAHLQARGLEAADYHLTLTAQMKAKAEEITDPREKQAYLTSIPLTVPEFVNAELVHAYP